MKPTISETGTILRTDGDMAVVLLSGGSSCKGCGAGKIGLCKPGGKSMMLTVGNAAGGHAGDTVEIGLDRRVKIYGYFLAYLVPLFSLLGGSLAGYVLGSFIGIPWLDVIAGIVSFSLASFYSFRELRKLDNTASLIVSRVVYKEIFTPECKSDEEKRYEEYAING